MDCRSTRWDKRIYNSGEFCILIGLCDDGVPVFGIVYSPVTGDLCYGQKGQGSFVVDKKGNRKGLGVSKQDQVIDSVSILKISKQGENRFDKISKELLVREKISLLSTGLEMMSLAKGESDFLINSKYLVSKWDTCAAQIILEEAGGVINDLHGDAINYKSNQSLLNKGFFATNRNLYQPVKSLLRTNL